LKSRNQILCLLLLSNVIILFCIALVNDLTGYWGVFLYLPGVLFIPHYQVLNLGRSLTGLFITGLFYDHLFHHTFGFHAFIFCFIFLISKEFFHLGKQSFNQIVLFQALINLTMGAIWALSCFTQNSLLGVWPIQRFIIDILISTLLLIPISIWFTNFCDAWMGRFHLSTAHKAKLH